MLTNALHQHVINENDLIDVIYSGKKDLNDIIVNDSSWIKKYNKYCELFELKTVNWNIESTLQEYDFIDNCLSNWHIPDNYVKVNLKEFLLHKCINSEQRARVMMEWDEFRKRNMLHVLDFLKYFVDTLTQNNVMWGIGRGSSVSSYILFLLGVHRIDSILYELDIKEFLK